MSRKFNRGDLVSCTLEDYDGREIGICIVDAEYTDIDGRQYYVVLDSIRVPVVVLADYLFCLPEHFKLGQIV
jgi:hypothetical protein